MGGQLSLLGKELVEKGGEPCVGDRKVCVVVDDREGELVVWLYEYRRGSAVGPEVRGVGMGWRGGGDGDLQSLLWGCGKVCKVWGEGQGVAVVGRLAGDVVVGEAGSGEHEPGGLVPNLVPIGKGLQDIRKPQAPGGLAGLGGVGPGTTPLAVAPRWRGS